MTCYNRRFLARAGAIIAAGTLAILASTTPVNGAQIVPKPKADGATVVLSGGFLPPGYTRTSLPTLHVISGKVYLPAAITMIYPGPAVSPVEVRTPRASSLRSALLALYAAAKTPRGGWGEIRLPDAGTTEVSVSVDGRTRKVSVHALGVGDQGGTITLSQRQSRERLIKAIIRLESVRGTSRMYTPGQLEAWPATSMIDDPSFTATFPWPGSSAPTGCTVIAAADLPSGVNQASMFFFGSERFAVQFRPVLPGEVACVRR